MSISVYKKTKPFNCQGYTITCNGMLLYDAKSVGIITYVFAWPGDMPAYEEYRLVLHQENRVHEMYLALGDYELIFECGKVKEVEPLLLAQCFEAFL